MADSYYAYENGQYVPLTASNGGTSGGAGGVNIANGTSVTPNSTFGTLSNNGTTLTPYTGAVYAGTQGSNGSTNYSLFSSGSATSPGSTATPTSTAPAATPTAGSSTAPVTPSVTANNQSSGPAPGIANSGTLQGTALLAQQMNNIQNQTMATATNPQLPAAATATPVNQQVQSGEMLSQQTEDPSTGQINTAEGNIPASTVSGAATAANPTTGLTAATYNAALVDPSVIANTTQAVTASLPADALVSTQLQELLTPNAQGQLPSWIQPAITAANQLLTGRGIPNSTMAAQAITTAILTAAIPVATSNASAELTAWQQNLTNEQQAAMQNGQNVVNTILSNQGAINAAQNFNATSENQTNQYLGSMAAQINQFNATQVNAVAQFNATQTQTAATNSAQLQAQLDEFNANMSNQVSQFNIQNAITIQQSNAEYLRAVNTANTAVQNQDNQLNATNAMNMSDTAMANLQQEFNDDATMLYNSGMTEEEQNYSLQYLGTQYALQDNLDQDLSSMEQNQVLSSALGTAASNILGPSLTNIGNSLSSLFGPSSTPVDGAPSTATNQSPTDTNPTDPGNTDTNVGGTSNIVDPNSNDSGDSFDSGDSGD